MKRFGGVQAHTTRPLEDEKLVKEEKTKLKESTMLMENGVEVVVNVQLAQIKMYYFKAMVERMIFVGKVFFSLLSFLSFWAKSFLSLAKFTAN